MTQLLRAFRAVASASRKQLTRNRIYLTILLMSLFLILSSPLLLKFGPEFLMVREMTVSTALLGGTALALVAGCSAIHSIRDSATIDTLMTKPLGKQLFLVAMYIGIMWSITLYIVFCSFASFLAISFKAQVYDKVQPDHIAAAFVMVFLNVAIVAGISLSLSTLCRPSTNLFFTMLLLVLLYAGPSILPGTNLQDAVLPLRPLDSIAVLSERTDYTPSFLPLSVLYGFLLIGAIVGLGAWTFNQQEPSRP